MRLSVVMGQAGKVLGAETPLTQPSISGGPESSDPRQASSSPLCTWLVWSPTPTSSRYWEGTKS